MLGDLHTNHNNRHKDNKRDLCSIEELENDTPLEEMLLSSPKNKTILEEEEDEFFDNYITPFAGREVHPNKPRDTIYEDTTILQFGKQEEASSTQLYHRHEEEEINRLKNIIDSKNKLIDQLTEDLRDIAPQSNYSKKASRRKQQQFMDSKGFQEYPTCRECKCRRSNEELEFLQRNNMELFEELGKSKAERDKHKQDAQKLVSKVAQLEVKLKQIQNQNRDLKRHNILLLRQTNQFIAQSKIQMKYVAKMQKKYDSKLREIIILKTGIQQLMTHSPKRPQCKRQPSSYTKNYTNQNNKPRPKNTHQSPSNQAQPQSQSKLSSAHPKQRNSCPSIRPLKQLRQ